MNKKKSVILISSGEVCYHPRLAKAASCFYKQGYDVDVFNPVIGISDISVYKNFIKNKKWNIREFDIRKSGLIPKINWLTVSILNKTFWFLYKKTSLNFGFKYLKNKGLFGFNKNKKKYDVIIVNLIDNLPFAVSLKKKYKNSVLIYDSQEFFTGQYAKSSNIFEKKWVTLAEKKYIHNADLILTTTNVMKKRIIKQYDLKVPVLRVRNLPENKNNNFAEQNDNITRFVWHGMRIIFNNERGVHVILKAFAKAQTKNSELYLQGLINNAEKQKIEQFIKNNNLKNKVFILPPAPPDKIVQSVIKYDAGLLGELPKEDNQLLTSSNKLFEYLSAGLAVIVPDIPGIKETVSEYNTGEVYEPGNINAFAEKIKLLSKNNSYLKEIKNKSRKLASNFIFWNNDYKHVIFETEKLLS